MKMAYIRKRKDGWFAEIRRKGYSPLNKTLKTQVAAKAWARRIEASMDNGTWIDTSASGSVLIEHIVDEAIKKLANFGIPVAGPKLSQLNQIKDYFYGTSIHDLAYDDLIDFAAERKQTVGASTLQTQMYYFKQLLKDSRIRTAEPVIDQAIDYLTQKKIIMGSKRRDRRLEPGEYEAFLQEATSGTRLHKKHWVYHAMEIAVESGMRQGEIHALKWSDVDYKKGIIQSMRKDRYGEKGKSLRKIPLLQGAREALLRAQDELGGDGSVFKIASAASISDKFARMRERIGITDLRFHDLRHEAISRMFERGMTVEEVMPVSGHRTLDQLSRYINLRPEDIAAKH
jgi:integrase